MKTTNLVSVIFSTMLLAANVPAASIEFELLTHADNVGLLPQPKGDPCVSGDHLIQTADDISDGYNPDGCFSFNLMNPVGISEPDYPPGYAESIHSMTGSVTLEINLYTGGTVEVTSLAFEGYVAQGKLAHQWLVQPGDPAADGNHGLVDGIPNSGAYAASATANWAFGISFDWYYDTPWAGPGGIDMTFDNYQWSGFIIPVSELTTTGMAMTMLNDPLGYFDGTSEEFESWLLNEVKPRLPQDAAYLLFAQGEAHPAWRSPGMGMPLEGIVGETIIGYAVQQPPQCGDPNHPYPPGDINQDCNVNLLDLAVVALHWLECTAPE
jgi:hypothetical protein